jgi:glycosyltransferase involved in cell wall biosynthesis
VITLTVCSPFARHGSAATRIPDVLVRRSMTMRIAVDARKIDDFGIGSYLRGLLTALVESHPQERFTLLGHTESLGDLAGSGNVELVDYRSPLYSVRELYAPRRIVREHHIDLFHEPHYTLPFVPVPSVVTIHDLIHLHLKGASSLHRRAYARTIIVNAARRATGVICVSRTVADELIALVPDVAGKVQVIPNGVDARFHQEPAFRLIEQELTAIGVRPKGYFLAVGNDKAHKNLDRQVAAFARLRERGSQSSLVIVGAVPERFLDVEGVVLAGRVSFDALRALYRGALALTFVTLEEGFGLPAAEAMVSGTPVIVSATPIMREVTGGAGLAVDPQRVESIAEAMWHIESDGPLRMDLAERGREEAERFDWGVAAEQTMALYRQCAGR